jgi:EmrB/QacA subfamily drug resistance transporter
MTLRNWLVVAESGHASLLKWLKSVTRRPATADRAGAEQATWHDRAVLIGLMMPFLMLTINMSMISVALPSIRSTFEVKADLVAWVVTAYTLPYVILMPLYGRFGDAFGKRRLFMIGGAAFLSGTGVCLLADTLPMLMLGRAIQGAGAAGISPLAIAMISELFPVTERGWALGAWNSIGPAGAIAGGLLAGPLIDSLGWQGVFFPVLLVGLVALCAVQLLVPSTRSTAHPRFIHTLDWGGVMLLGTSITVLLFFVSSKPITNVAPLQDWRLLAAALSLFVTFIVWERRLANPFVSLDIFSHRPFTLASLCVALRMFTMSGISLLVPLYLADVQQLSVVSIGLVLMTHAGGLFPAMRLGGKLADRWGSRWPVLVGMSGQAAIMVYFALLSKGAPLGLVVMGLLGHGLAAGLSLPALHRAAMGGVPPRRTGVAAGIYSMIRFCGTALGTALQGVLLQQGLDRGLLAIDAYHACFWFAAAVALPGALIALKLREE